MSEEKKLADTQCYYSPDTGTVEGPVHCGVCGTQMSERRNCYGPRGFAMAMMGSKSHYDEFTCPHRGEMWHKQVIDLRKLAKETPSSKLEAIFKEEIDGILDTRTATKETGGWRYGYD
jgi:hypothetical protein